MTVRLLSRFSSLATALICFSAFAQAAFIDPANDTGTLGTDPNNFNGAAPLAINTNTIATVRTTTPWTRASASTTYQGWDVFANTSAANNPNDPAVLVNVLGQDLIPRVDAAPFNPNGTATITATGGAIPTGSGNLYSPSAALSFSIPIPNYGLGAGFATNYLIQLRALTGDFDPATSQLNGVPVSALPNYSLQLINQQSYGSFMGTTTAYDYKLEFSVLGNAASDTFTFASLGTGLSLDKISIDTSVTAVPEPSSMIVCTLLGIPGYILLRRQAAVCQ